MCAGGADALPCITDALPCTTDAVPRIPTAVPSIADAVPRTPAALPYLTDALPDFIPYRAASAFGCFGFTNENTLSFPSPYDLVSPQRGLLSWTHHTSPDTSVSWGRPVRSG